MPFLLTKKRLPQLGIKKVMELRTRNAELEQRPLPNSKRVVEDTCAICFGKLADATSLVSVKCGHIFINLKKQ
ncbi:unnamed protein product [Brachionus calyciflorus]|uniref:Uncharacterized protein n=1 Tax=Brachionus calyciflorus TaxID=104777 RepID=A0A814AK48_9BILA|nr:unnamed protein product [Brachionus calyciflorus]